jgi:hypothetical protein
VLSTFLPAAEVGDFMTDRESEHEDMGLRATSPALVGRQGELARSLSTLMV